MAIHMRTNGPNGRKHIKNHRRHMQCTTIPTLTNHASKQGGYLPRKLQKQWKKGLSTYHIIRKAIKIITQDTNSRIHTILSNLQNHQHAEIPNPPNDPLLTNEWIKTL
jgi:hypothetical protein